MSSQPPRILLFGKNGQVGFELVSALGGFAHLTALGSSEVDLKDSKAIRRSIRETRPDILINAAAYTAVDLAESESEAAMQINGATPGIMAEEMQQTGGLLVHYSTDYVFDGTKRTPYVETDPPNPLGAYGHSKLAGEESVRASGAAHLIFRLCWVYSTRSRNFFLTMRRLARDRDVLRVVSDQVGCPTWSRPIARATAECLQQVWNNPGRVPFSGTYHLCAPDSTSWHGFASEIIESIDPSDRKCRVVEAIATTEYPTPARRPGYSVMSTEKLGQRFGITLPAWREQLQGVVEEHRRAADAFVRR